MKRQQSRDQDIKIIEEKINKNKVQIYTEDDYGIPMNGTVSIRSGSGFGNGNDEEEEMEYSSDEGNTHETEY